MYRLFHFVTSLTPCVSHSCPHLLICLLLISLSATSNWLFPLSFQAFTIVGTEPVESLVPLVAELRRLRGGGGARRLLGCVELHAVRANTALADFLNVPPEQVRLGRMEQRRF